MQKDQKIAKTRRQQHATMLSDTAAPRPPLESDENDELSQLRGEVLRLRDELKRQKQSAGALKSRLTNKGNSLEAAYREMETAYRRAQHLAAYDAVTALPNRRFFNDRLSQALSLAQRQRSLCAVLVVDLDYFKKVNDLLGHSTGDHLLRVVAERLVSCVRSSDTVARMSGDEFAVVLQDVLKPEVVGKIAEKMNQALAVAYLIRGITVHVTASIGIATFPGDANDPISLFHQADLALYQAKRNGRNGFAFATRELSIQAKSRVELENELYDALEAGDFELHYQPKIDTETNQIVSTEALIRWRHPTRGFLSPAEFIPIAEESNLVTEIGEWVLMTACAQNMAWQRAGYDPISVAVNVSMRQLERQQDLISVVKRVLRMTELDAGWLELELTEGVFLKDSDHAIGVLQQLRDIGLTIAIDDFGIGYSSLGKLHQLPIDHIKIDRSFIRSVTDNPSERFILEAIISLAHGLGLKMIAEGIETKEQLRFLSDRGCQQWQGYYCSKPVAADVFEQLLRASVVDLDS